MLTKKQREQVAERLKLMRLRGCPMCGDDRRAVEDLVIWPVAPRQYTVMPVMIDPCPPHEMPVVLMSCETCGFVAAFDAVRLLAPSPEVVTSG